MDKELLLKGVEEITKWTKILEDNIREEKSVYDYVNTGKPLLDIPFAIQSRVRIQTQGKYDKLYPEGAVVHFNAGHSMNGDKAAVNCIDYLASKKYPCIIISRSGNVHQAFPLDEWGWHCGTHHHEYCVGIELLNPGKLKQLPSGDYESWFHEMHKASEVRVVEARDDIEAGAYLPCTFEQQQSLLRLLLWLKRNGPDIFNIANIHTHAEICPGRKNDPGAIIDWCAAELRVKMSELYNAKAII